MMNPGGPQVKHPRTGRWKPLPVRGHGSAGPERQWSPLVDSPSTSQLPPTFAIVIVTWLL
jgi:hypothetical protein